MSKAIVPPQTADNNAENPFISLIDTMAKVEVWMQAVRPTPLPPSKDVKASISKAIVSHFEQPGGPDRIAEAIYYLVEDAIQFRNTVGQRIRAVNDVLCDMGGQRYVDR